MSTKVLSLPLFPVPVSIYNYGEDNHNLNINLVRDILQEHSIDNVGSPHSNMGGWHSQTDLETKYDSFQNLARIINQAGKEYCKTHGYNDSIKCKDLWANINKKGDLNFNHHHGLSALAGVYYPIESLDTNLNFNYTEGNPLKPGTWDNTKGGSLVFQDPAYGKKVHLVTSRPSAFNVDFYHLYPTSSILVLFPTYLLHMVLPFQEDKTRISISFSFEYE